MPIQFGARIVAGALSGAAIAGASGSLIAGAIAGAIGAVIGTLVGHAGRAQLARQFGQDSPAVVVEDVIAIVGALRPVQTPAKIALLCQSAIMTRAAASKSDLLDAIFRRLDSLTKSESRG